MKLRNGLIALAMVASAWISAGLVTAQVTWPDTSCASAVGLGENDIPHAYYGTSDVLATAEDACPDHYSGELGFGDNGVWLFSREGAGVHGGDGVVACYGSTDPTSGPTTGHHGHHTQVVVKDDAFGGAVAFSITRDYNRTSDNPFLPASNNAGDFDCGDSLVEPCDPADGSGTDYTTAPGCNPLDRSEFNFPADGLCLGLSSLSNLLAPDVDPPTDFVTLVTNFLLSLLGLTNGGATCEIPPVNKWTVPNGETLADFAGADGAVVVFIEGNARFDAGHFGTGTTGAVWTDGAGSVAGGCVASPGLDGFAFTCTYASKNGCTWTYRSNNPQPRQPGPGDMIISKTCPSVGSAGGGSAGGSSAGGGSKKCTGMVNVCLKAKSCSGGTLNVCPGANCSGWVNVCAANPPCTVCDGSGRIEAPRWPGTTPESPPEDPFAAGMES